MDSAREPAELKERAVREDDDLVREDLISADHDWDRGCGGLTKRNHRVQLVYLLVQPNGRLGKPPPSFSARLAFVHRSLWLDQALDNLEAIWVLPGPLLGPVEEVDDPPWCRLRRRQIQILTTEVRKKHICVSRVLGDQGLRLVRVIVNP